MNGLERWLTMIPKQELNQPVVEVEGRRLTPVEVVNEVRQGTELGRKAKIMLETIGLGTEEDILVERLKNRFSRYPQNQPLFITLKRDFTPAQLIAEVEGGTAMGKQLLEAESNYLKYIGSLMERA